MLSYAVITWCFLSSKIVCAQNPIKEEINEINKTAGIEQDSYIQAYLESHGGNVNPNKFKTDRKTSYPTDFAEGFSNEYYGDEYNYPPSHHHYNNYGPPHHPHGPPFYKPPKPFHEPNPPYNYGSSFNGIPYSLIEGILDKFKFKWNLITIFKIILKIVLFKKLVSFLAIICLLLFIPWLKAKKDHHLYNHGGNGAADEDEEDEDVMMKYRLSSGNKRLDNLTEFVLRMIENYKKQT